MYNKFELYVTRTYAVAEPIERVLRFRQYRDGRNVIL